MQVSNLEGNDGVGRIGALARIDRKTLIAAMRNVKQGRIYDLGLELNDRMPCVPGFAPFSLVFTHSPRSTASKSPFEFSAESISGTPHSGTHIDALIHVQANGRVYGGDFVSDLLDEKGWKKNGMETVPPILGRAVVLDIAALLNCERLPDGHEIKIEELQCALRASRQSVTPGDIVLVRTGKIQQFDDPKAFQAGQPGLGRAAALWLYESGMAVLGTDTMATEPVPFIDPASSTHRAMLVDSGVHLIENLNLERVAGDRVTEGLFIGLPLKITGGTGSWIRPVVLV
jgi:kynurenine formamidase